MDFPERCMSRTFFHVSSLIVGLLTCACMESTIHSSCSLPTKTQLMNEDQLVEARIALADSCEVRRNLYGSDTSAKKYCLKVSDCIVESLDGSGFLLFSIALYANDSIHDVSVAKLVFNGSSQFFIGETGYYLGFIHDPKTVTIDSLVRHANRILPTMLRWERILSDSSCVVDAKVFRDLPMYSFRR
jgi:hypothetical protein